MERVMSVFLVPALFAAVCLLAMTWLLCRVVGKAILGGAYLFLAGIGLFRLATFPSGGYRQSQAVTYGLVPLIVSFAVLGALLLFRASKQHKGSPISKALPADDRGNEPEGTQD